jgi:hypothetical protein
MATKTLSTKVGEDSELADNFDEFADKHTTQSEAMRVAIRRGMAQSGGSDATSQFGERVAWGVLAFALAALAFGQSLPAGVFAAVAGAVFIGVAVYRWREQQ